MIQRIHRLPALLATLAALPFALSQAYASTTATWVGGSNQPYTNAANWDVKQVPLNSAAATYDVVIGNSVLVNYAATANQSIDSLQLGFGSTLNLTSGNLLPPTFTVLGTALFGGSIAANGASFSAMGAGTDFLGTASTISAANRAAVSIATADFNVRGINGGTVLNAAGKGSQINLAALPVLDSGGTGNYWTNTVSATDGGAIKLSALTTIVAPASGASNLAFVANNGGSLDLSALQTVTGLTLSSGNTSFSSDNGTVQLGSLQKADRLTVSLKNGATLSVGGYAGNVAITDSSLFLTGGSTMNAATMVGDYAVRGYAGGTFLSASGAGSMLDLSGLRSLDSGGGGNYWTNTVAASDGGVIKLSAVKTLIAPASGASTLAFVATTTGSIDLSKVQTITGPTISSGSTSFSADNATITLGPLQKADRIGVTLKNAASMSVGGYAGSAAVTDSTLAVLGASVLNASTMIGSLTVRGFNGATFLSASGAGSQLDLSGLRLVDSGGTGNYWTNTVSATDGGRIDLSGVKTLVAPASTASNLAFVANNGGAIDLRGVQTVTGLTIGSGATNFSADHGTITIGPLQKVDRSNFSLNNGATMSVGGYAGIASITDSGFSVAGGSTLNAAALKGDYSVRAYNGGTFVSTSGAGSRLDLSGLRSLDSGGSGNYWTNVVSAADSGAIDLSGVTTLVAPTSGVSTLAFNATNRGSIDLSSLQTIVSAGGHVAFNATLGGSITLHGMSAGPGDGFSLINDGSRLNFKGSLALLNGSTVSAGAGTLVGLTGNFSFEQTVESQVNLDFAALDFSGTGLHTLEIGSKKLATLPAAGAAVTGNFAIGQLGVGQVGGASVVRLVDAIDNGNRSSPETLYLNGVDGGNGLSILGGSTLQLDGLNLYAAENGQWVHINDLFMNGATRIVYDQGFIMLGVAAVPEPESLALMLAGLAGIAMLMRRRKISD